MVMPIAVLVSGSGSNLQSIIDRSQAGVLKAKVVLVLSNNPEAQGLARAAEQGIPHLALPNADFPSRQDFEQAMIRAIKDSGAQAVALAGFMRILSPEFLRAFPGRVLNIHPSLLPSFPGVRAQGQAADHGVKLSGCTVHFVDEKMDHGPIIIQAAAPAHDGDEAESLGGRILRLEHLIYPQALQWLATGRLEIKGRKVALKPAGPAQADPGPGCLINPPLEEGFVV
jgi:phosphoribosylglycinamide formyltransferase-1